MNGIQEDDFCDLVVVRSNVLSDYRISLEGVFLI